MSLKDRLAEDMKEALKAREAGKLRLSVIRMVRAAVKNQEIERGHELSDEEVTEVLSREVKLRRDAIPEYEKANRPETVEALKQEINILMEYLPRQLTAEEIAALVKQAVKETGAQGLKDLGKVMGRVAPLTKGKADGRTVNEIAKRILGGES